MSLPPGAEGCLWSVIVTLLGHERLVLTVKICLAECNMIQGDLFSSISV